jgi:hypothetical protein
MGGPRSEEHGQGAVATKSAVVTVPEPSRDGSFFGNRHVKKIQILLGCDGIFLK